MQKLNFLAKCLLSTLLLLIACDDENIEPVKDCDDFITTIQYTLTPISGGPSVVLKYEDLDGDGGIAPTITEGILDTNQTYIGLVELFDESTMNAEYVSQEILEEGQDYQFFFVPMIADINVTYTDQDVDGKPIGLKSRLTTKNRGSGQLEIILRQEPDKFANEVEQGRIENAGGETDVAVSFPILVQ